MIPNTDLVTANNVIFTTSGSRKNRQGISYWDNIELPAASSVTRTSNVVTITFASTISDGTNKKLVVGEKITVICADATYNVTNVAITAVTGTTITYPATGSNGSTTLTSIVRSSQIVGHHDFWYFDNSLNEKVQSYLAMTSQGKLFKYDSSGNRLEVTLQTLAPNGTVATSTFSYGSHGFILGDTITFTSVGTVTGISTGVVYYVRDATTNTFKISATPGGTAITLGGSDSNVEIASPLLDAVTRAQFLTMNERCIIAMDGADNWPKLFDPSVSTTVFKWLRGAPPNFSIMSLHQGRIFADDKNNLDLLHYSSPINHEEWQGVGDSGAVYVGLGDGDPTGIRAISPSFKGNIFIGKTKTAFRLLGPVPEEYQVVKISTGIGMHSQKSIASIDLDDMLFVSDKGVHSIAATADYGDFKGAYISQAIQPTFNSFVKTRIPFTSAVYMSNLSSVIFSVSELSNTSQDTLYVYNTLTKAWSRWPDISVSSLGTRLNNSAEQLIGGDYNSRLLHIYNGSYTDYTTEAIPYRVKTGAIYVDGSPNTVKAFKGIGFLFKPVGNYTLTANLKIDNYPVQSVAFNRTASGDLLGSTFILGQSVLSYNASLQPFMMTCDGYGHGITVELINSGVDEVVEIYGIIIKWEMAGSKQEVFVTGDTTE